MDTAQIYQHLEFIYGRQEAEYIYKRLQALLTVYATQIPTAQKHAGEFDQADAILITYGDMLRAEGERPLQILANFTRDYLQGVVNSIHLLPFYPYSSDDGFSVIDYHAVDPALGTWADVSAVGHDFHLMFDAVINHISAQSSWFQKFVEGDPFYEDYFVVVDPDTDLSAVFRPRALPLLTAVATKTGTKHVWTTFSPDQIDLNFANPEVLLAIIDLLLFYVTKGAELIRLDAIAFMWKEVGTNCLHREQTHRIIQLWRSVLDIVAPQVVLITETNVPHEENISYFGDGQNEAQMVYNFSLPPLTLHAFHTGNAEILSSWAQTLTLPSNRVTFFNFLASHDGIGLTPARGLLPDSAVDAIAERVQRLGGYVSYRNNPDGSQSPYELNINYLDALGKPDQPDEPTDQIARRFLAAQAIMLALRGVPGIYFHSLFGSRGWPEGAKETGRARTINRQKLEVEHLKCKLAQPGSLRQQVFNGLRHMLHTRARSPAFSPIGEQEVQWLHPAVFAVQRSAPDSSETILCLHNVSVDTVAVRLPAGRFSDLLTEGPEFRAATIILSPYQIMWLRQED